MVLKRNFPKILSRMKWHALYSFNMGVDIVLRYHINIQN